MAIWIVIIILSIGMLLSLFLNAVAIYCLREGVKVHKCNGKVVVQLIKDMERIEEKLYE